MAEKTLSNNKKKELAKILFMNSGMSQKDIATEVGTSQQTMVKWVGEGKWDEIKSSVNATNTEQIGYLNKMLKLLNEQGIKALMDDDPTTNPDNDGIIKLTKAIHYLQTKTSAGQMYETGLEFLKFLQKEEPLLAKQVAPLFTVFIKQMV